MYIKKGLFDGIIILVVGALPESRYSGDSGGTWNAHIYKVSSQSGEEKVHNRFC